MKSRIKCRVASRKWLVTAFLPLLATLLVISLARAEIEPWKARFVAIVGHTWFCAEQLADDVCSRIATPTSTLKKRIFPAIQPAPPPTPVHSMQLSDDTASAPADTNS